MPSTPVKKPWHWIAAPAEPRRASCRRPLRSWPSRVTPVESLRSWRSCSAGLAAALVWLRPRQPVSASPCGPGAVEAAWPCGPGALRPRRSRRAGCTVCWPRRPRPPAGGPGGPLLADCDRLNVVGREHHDCIDRISRDGDGKIGCNLHKAHRVGPVIDERAAPYPCLLDVDWS